MPYHISYEVLECPQPLAGFFVLYPLQCLFLISLSILSCTLVGVYWQGEGIHFNTLQPVMYYRFICLSLPENNDLNPVMKIPSLHICNSIVSNYCITVEPLKKNTTSIRMWGIWVNGKVRSPFRQVVTTVVYKPLNVQFITKAMSSLHCLFWSDPL